MPSSCDVIIIGTGPAGIFAALELVKSSSLKVILIEKEAISGNIPAPCRIRYSLRSVQPLWRGGRRKRRRACPHS
jgi:glycine/D-amino acid oxidase-like deaminating enzyme